MVLPMAIPQHIPIRSTLVVTQDFPYTEHLPEHAKRTGHGRVEKHIAKARYFLLCQCITASRSIVHVLSSSSLWHKRIDQLEIKINGADANRVFVAMLPDLASF